MMFVMMKTQVDSSSGENIDDEPSNICMVEKEIKIRLQIKNQTSSSTGFKRYGNLNCPSIKDVISKNRFWILWAEWNPGNLDDSNFKKAWLYSIDNLYSTNLAQDNDYTQYPRTENFPCVGSYGKLHERNLN